MHKLACRRQQSQKVTFSRSAGATAFVQPGEPVEQPPQIARPRPASLETMTHALLGDLAGHMTQMRQLTEEVRSLKAQNAELVQQVARGGPRRGRGPPSSTGGLPSDWQSCLEEQLVQTQHLQEQASLHPTLVSHLKLPHEYSFRGSSGSPISSSMTHNTSIIAPASLGTQRGPRVLTSPLSAGVLGRWTSRPH